jgi:F-type H+-transporting ATPase subunit delta
MPRRLSARRYAQALFQLALEKDEIELWRRELEVLGEAIQQEELVLFLNMPKVLLDQKMAVIKGAFPDLNPLAHNLLGLLISRRVVETLPSIREEYGVLLDRHQGLERAQVVSAVPLEEDHKNRLALYLKDLIGKEVVLTATVDPGVVAGLVARVGDRLIDGSVRTRLQDMRRSLAEAAL